VRSRLTWRLQATARLRFCSMLDAFTAPCQSRIVGRKAMSDETPPQMFPESRVMLGLLSPILGVFFAVCIYFTRVWQPFTIGDRIGKFAIEDILFTFITLCGVGVVASVVGPDRIRPLILRIGGKATRAGVALILGTVAYMLYCWVAL